MDKKLFKEWLKQAPRFRTRKYIKSQKALYEYFNSLIPPIYSTKNRIVKYKTCCRYIIDNFIIVSLNLGLPLGVSRSEQHDKPMNSQCWTSVKDRRVILDTLLNEEYIIQVQKGCHLSWKKEVGKYYATKKLYNLCKSFGVRLNKTFYTFDDLMLNDFQPSFSYKDFSDWRNEEVFCYPTENTVVMKDITKKIIKFKDTRRSMVMEKFIKKYNKFMDKQNMTLVYESEWDSVHPDDKNKLRLLCGGGKLKFLGFFANPDSTIPLNQEESSKSNLISNHLSNTIIPISNTNTNIPIDILGYDNSDIKPKRGSTSHSNLPTKCIKFKLIRNESYRVFNNAWDKGGRFYGQVSLEIPSCDRKYIRINNNRTIELDYSSLHIKLLYAKLGINYTDDPYLVEGYPRDIFKVLSLTLINAKCESEAIWSIITKGVDESIKKANRKGKDIAPILKMRDYKYVKKAIGCFKIKHEPISKWFCSNVGIKLQYEDSCIMEKILRDCLKLNIPAISVHDSCIVEERYEDILRVLMVKYYKKWTGFEPIIH